MSRSVGEWTTACVAGCSGDDALGEGGGGSASGSCIANGGCDQTVAGTRLHEGGRRSSDVSAEAEEAAGEEGSASTSTESREIPAHLRYSLLSLRTALSTAGQICSSRWE